MKNLFAFVLICFALVFCVSCDTLKVLENTELLTENNTVREPQYVISFHEVVKYPRADLLEHEMETLNGTKIYINVNSMLHSRNIKKIVMVPIRGGEGGYDLAFTFDKRGKMLWGNVSLTHKHGKIAMIIDGIAYKTFSPDPLPLDPEEVDQPEASVLIRGPFDKNTAGNIVFNSELNYKRFND